MRNRVLVLSQCLPFPPHSGVTNRTYHVLNQLQREFDVTLVPFSRRNHQSDAAARARAATALRNDGLDVRTPVPIPSEWSRRRKLLNHARSLMSGEPYIYYEYADPKFARELATAIDQVCPDLVHLDSLDLYRWLPCLPAVPTACTHHSIESDLLRLRADRIPRCVMRSYLMHQAGLLEQVEKALCPRFGVNVMMSETDASRLRALVTPVRTTVVPNGVDVDYFRPLAPETVVDGLVSFLGPTYMFPNLDAVDFFLDSVWAHVLERRSDSTFHLVGKNSAEQKARFERHRGVTAHGYVPDIRPYLAQAACSVVPLRVGGGTRLKILDAWSMGKAVVSTSVGCEGLETADGDNILIRDDPIEFAAAIVSVLSDRDLRDHLGREARRTVEKRYSWNAVGRELNECYRSLIGSRPGNESGTGRPAGR
jgi:glycosyltransferase involved in cell wall biosynthesis